MFRFTFQSLLNYQKQLEKKFQQDYAKLKRRLDREKEKLNMFYQTKQKLLQQWKEFQKEDVSISSIHLIT